MSLPLQPNLAGMYRYSPARLELKPVRFEEAPDGKSHKVYSIRIGQKNHDKLFINFSNYHAHTCQLFGDAGNSPDQVKGIFTYHGIQYFFTISRSSKEEQLVSLTRL